jgi:hypothetical protein
MSKSRFLDSAISLIRVVKKEGITLWMNLTMRLINYST